MTTEKSLACSPTSRWIASVVLPLRGEVMADLLVRFAVVYFVITAIADRRRWKRAEQRHTQARKA